jgi:hypothetical protein
MNGQIGIRYWNSAESTFTDLLEMIRYSFSILWESVNILEGILATEVVLILVIFGLRLMLATVKFLDSTTV